MCSLRSDQDATVKKECLAFSRTCIKSLSQRVCNFRSKSANVAKTLHQLYFLHLETALQQARSSFKLLAYHEIWRDPCFLASAAFCDRIMCSRDFRRQRNESTTGALFSKEQEERGGNGNPLGIRYESEELETTLRSRGRQGDIRKENRNLLKELQH